LTSPSAAGLLVGPRGRGQLDIYVLAGRDRAVVAIT
jgi:hypothetical protein